MALDPDTTDEPRGGSHVLPRLRGIVAAVDSRLVAVRLHLRVELVMFGLILVGAVRARHGFLTDRPLTWAMGAGVCRPFRDHGSCGAA